MSAPFAVIGFGNMGAAVVSGALRSGVIAADDTVVIEQHPERRAAAAMMGCEVSEDPAAAGGARHVLLAVKPQSFPEVARRLAPAPDRSVFISVMAGIAGSKILAALGPPGSPHAVVRAMPNSPCRIGLGMTAIAPSAGCRPGDEAFACRLFEAVGRTAIVEEDLLDAVTAVSGSGPAYLFMLAEAWERAAVDLGFDPDTARLLVTQTILGSSRLLAEPEVDPRALREAVTSKGGTTAAAIAVLERRGFADILHEAIRAAETRGRELGAG
jgi:pyrroline-5-carboxylate reductase